MLNNINDGLNIQQVQHPEGEAHVTSYQSSIAACRH